MPVASSAVHPDDADVRVHPIAARRSTADGRRQEGAVRLARFVHVSQSLMYVYKSLTYAYESPMCVYRRPMHVYEEADVNAHSADVNVQWGDVSVQTAVVNVQTGIVCRSGRRERPERFG